MIEEIRMPIGKYRNKLVAEIKDIEYLKNIIISLRFGSTLREAIIKQIKKLSK